MQYRHVQIGYLMIVISILLIIIFLTIPNQEEDMTFPRIVLGAALIIIASFSTLKVWTDTNNLSLRFGYGIFSKKFELKEISSAKAVRNKWYFGWGIRYNIALRQWIFNVSGLGAVEILMKNGKSYRIGTDEPEKLEQAIKQASK